VWSLESGIQWRTVTKLYVGQQVLNYTGSFLSIGITVPDVVTIFPSGIVPVPRNPDLDNSRLISGLEGGAIYPVTNITANTESLKEIIMNLLVKKELGTIICKDNHWFSEVNRARNATDSGSLVDWSIGYINLGPAFTNIHYSISANNVKFEIHS